MKKSAVAVLLAASMVLSMTACGSSSDSATTAASTEAETTAAETKAETTAAAGSYTHLDVYKRQVQTYGWATPRL